MDQGLPLMFSVTGQQDQSATSFHWSVSSLRLPILHKLDREAFQHRTSYPGCFNWQKFFEFLKNFNFNWNFIVMHSRTGWFWRECNLNSITYYYYYYLNSHDTLQAGILQCSLQVIQNHSG